MDKKLINEDISNMKYLFGYKPGRVISEQDFDYTTDDYLDTSEMTEDKDDLFLRRRLNIFKELIDKNIEKVNDEGGYGFSDEFEFANNIISWVVGDFTNYDYENNDYDELVDLIKDNFGEYILSQYVEEDFDDEDYDDDDEDFNDMMESRYDDDLSFHRYFTLKNKSARVVRNFLNSLSTEFIETKFITLSNCEYADFSGIDICGLPKLAYIRLPNTKNNFEEQGYECVIDVEEDFYQID